MLQGVCANSVLLSYAGSRLHTCLVLARGVQDPLALLQALAADDGRQLWEYELPGDWASASMDPTPDRSAAGGDEAGVAVTGVAAGYVQCILCNKVDMALTSSGDTALHPAHALTPLGLECAWCTAAVRRGADAICPSALRKRWLLAQPIAGQAQTHPPACLTAQGKGCGAP